jgi:hypothetical protein
MAIAELKDKEKAQVQTLRALMALHRLTVSDMSARTFIPQENIEAFLSGATASLSDPSFIEVFRSLGMDENGVIVSTRVHFWHIKMKRALNKENLLPLTNMLGHIGEHSAMSLDKKGNITPILLKADGLRIVLFVSGPRFMRINVADLGLNPGSFAGNHKVKSVPNYYYDLISMCALRPNYFDLILDGTYINEDIDLLRMVALEHDVTLSELVQYVIRNDQRAVEVTKEESTYESSVIPLHTSASATTTDALSQPIQASARG